MSGGAPDPPHAIVTVAGHGGYSIRCRLWEPDDACATVVAVHGVAGHSLWLEPVARRLAGRGVRTLAMDRRGAGMNGAGRGDAPSAEALIGDLAAVLRRAAADGAPVHLCGFCWGSVYAVNALAALDAEAGAAPEVVTAIHVAPSLFPSALVRERPLLTGDSGAPTEAPAMPIECFTEGPALEAIVEPDPLRLRAVSPRFNACLERFSAGLWMKLLRHSRPSLLLLAADDRAVDNAATERLFRRLDADRVSVRTVPGAHGVQFDAPEEAAALIAGWVRDAARDATSRDGGSRSSGPRSGGPRSGGTRKGEAREQDRLALHRSPDGGPER